MRHGRCSGILDGCFAAPSSVVLQSHAIAPLRLKRAEKLSHYQGVRPGSLKVSRMADCTAQGQLGYGALSDFAFSTVAMMRDADVPRIRHTLSSMSTVGDCRFRSSWLTYSREIRARAATCSCVKPALSRALLSSSPSMVRP